MVSIAAYEEIRRLLGGDDQPPRFIIRRHNVILGLCLNSTSHPRIYAHPAEVWIETGEFLKEWGERLAWDTGALSLYVSPDPGRGFLEMGTYHVIGSTDQRLELARRMAFPGIDNLSRIIFLSGPHSARWAEPEIRTEDDGFAE